VAWAVVVAPVLVLPGLLPESLGWVVAPLAVATLVWAMVLVRGATVPSIALATMLFAMVAVIGWRRGVHLGSNGEHFYGISLGVLLMVITAHWCTSRARLLVYAATFCVLGTVVLGLGLRSATPPPVEKRLPSIPLTPAWPQPRLAMEGYLDRPPAELERGIYVNPNALAAAALMVLPVAAALSVIPRNTPPGIGAVVAKGAGGATALWALLVIVSTQSRAAWLICGAMAAVTGWRFLWSRVVPEAPWRLRPRTSAWVVIAILIAVGVAVNAGPLLRGDLWDRVLESLSGRGALWVVALEWLRTAPWTGVGLDAFRYLEPGVPHAHNIVIQTALDIGVIGLGAYLAVVVWIVRIALRLGRQGRDRVVRVLATGGGAALVNVHLFGVVDAVSLGTKIGLLQWLACGLVLGAATVDRLGGREDQRENQRRTS